MKPEEQALITFARLGLKLFWLRQVMFLGATLITTLYLSSSIPFFCYLLCLGAELAESMVSRQILARPSHSAPELSRFRTYHSLIGAWSAASVSIYAILVAWQGPAEFLFVPLSYQFSAALYATMFDHQIKTVLVTRLVIYGLGFFILAGMSLFESAADSEFFGLAQFITVFSAGFFIMVNAVIIRDNYENRRNREQDLLDREARLRQEIESRHNAEIARDNSESRFHSLFDYAPIPIREEDLSGMKRRVDDLGFTDKATLEAYLDQHPEFLEACAREIVVVDANQASLRQHGYKEKTEMLDKVVRKLSPAAFRVVRMTILALFEGASGRSYETRITRSDGAIRTVAATWRVVPGHEQTYRRILLCSVDLTDRLAVEDALRQAQKMEAVGQLTGGVAHDFNNLLTVIRGNVELLELSANIDPALSTPIIQAVDRGAELTQRLLAFSRKQPLMVKTFDLGKMVSGMGHLLQRTLGVDTLIEIDLPNGLWPVQADPGQVEAALLNFALNSRDAMGKGGSLFVSCRNVAVAKTNELDLEAGDYVVLSVRDTGTGMDAETLSHIFEPFFTTKEVGKGSGLGLSMAYGFAKQSGGALEMTSTLGVGTNASLYLPRSQTPILVQDDTEVEDMPLATQSETVFLLEDDAGVRQYLTQLLSTCGYTVLQADSVKSARAIMATGVEIDLLISDICLPGGSFGPDFASELLAQRPELPVIFMSGHPSEIETAASGQFKDAAVLAKPFTKGMLLGRIDQAFADTRDEGQDA